MSPRKSSKLEPVIKEIPAQKMAVVRGKGAPDKVFAEAMPALYGSVYTLKFDLKKQGLETFKMGAPHARYPDALNMPKEKWTILVGLPIPEGTTLLPQKMPSPKVEIETWQYGTVAQILHEGS